MKNLASLLFTLLILLSYSIKSQELSDNWKAHEPSIENPYGSKNPKAPEQLDDFKPMIGTCTCKSLRRAPDGTWGDTTTMKWTFKYIMNGMAIQDQTWSDGFYATSIRNFHADSLKWVVSYSAFPGVTTTPSTWLGKKEGDDIVLEVPKNAPNGMEGVSRLTFTNIRAEGFDWKGEWINEAQAIVFPFWLIWCKKMD